MVADLFPVYIHHVNASNVTSDLYGAVPSYLNGGSANAKWKLVAVQMTPSLTITADNTNTRIYTVYGKDGTTATATRSTDADASPAGTTITLAVTESLTLTGGANDIFLPGDEIKITSGGGGTEPADNTLFCCLFELQR